MNILDNIAARKRLLIAENKALYPIKQLEQSPLYNRTTVSLTAELDKPGVSGIIAEFKRKSPSKGIINAYARVEEVTQGYAKAGASALSVLTDQEFFGGSNDDFANARVSNNCPILRKDFIVDPWQVVESRSIGADVILLIAAILTPRETLELATLARSLGMEIILEVHDISELSHLNDQISILGVNNRNLKDFKVSTEISFSIAKKIPAGITAISESGIRQPEAVVELRQAGYKGFLIGEQFMAEEDPAGACAHFISQINSRL